MVLQWKEMASLWLYNQWPTRSSMWGDKNTWKGGSRTKVYLWALMDGGQVRRERRQMYVHKQPHIYTGAGSARYHSTIPRQKRSITTRWRVDGHGTHRHALAHGVEHVACTHWMEWLRMRGRIRNDCTREVRQLKSKNGTDLNPSCIVRSALIPCAISCVSYFIIRSSNRVMTYAYTNYSRTKSVPIHITTLNRLTKILNFK